MTRWRLPARPERRWGCRRACVWRWQVSRRQLVTSGKQLLSVKSQHSLIINDDDNNNNNNW